MRRAITVTITRDPVCGRTVDPAAAPAVRVHRGQSYHFCSPGCRARFDEAPGAWTVATDPVCGARIDRASAAHIARHAGEVRYFCCARCRHVFEADPGAVVQTPGRAEGAGRGAPARPPGRVAEGHGTGRGDLRRALAGLAPLALASLLLGTPGGGAQALGPLAGPWVLAGLATASLWTGLPVLRRGRASVAARAPDRWTLVSLAVLLVWYFGIASLL